MATKAIIFISLLFLFTSSTFSQDFDKRDYWKGKYKGTSKNSSNRPYTTLKIMKRNVKGMASVAYSGRNTVGIYINLPSDYININGLTITKNKINFSATRKYPFDINLRISTDEYGDKQITGSFTLFKVLSDGSLSVLEKLTNIIVY